MRLKKISEKSGDLIMKKLGNTIPEGGSSDMILNRLISGNGIRMRRKK